jgi:hypothetical protein
VDTWFGPPRAGAHAVREIHRCERFTPRDSLIPWRERDPLVHPPPLRPGRSRHGAIQQSSADGHAISADTLDASESFPLAYRPARLITKRKRAAFHRKGNRLESATLCDTNL